MTRSDGNGRGPGLGLDLDGLLSQLGLRLGDLMQALDAGGAEQSQSRTFSTGNGPVKAEVRLRVGGVDHPGRMPAAGRKSADKAQDGDPVRIAEASAFCRDGQWSMTVELPGVTLAEVALSVEQGILHVRTTGARRFQARHPLPEGADTTDMSAVVRNGILVVSVPLSGSAPA